MLKFQQKVKFLSLNEAKSKAGNQYARVSFLDSDQKPYELFFAGDSDLLKKAREIKTYSDILITLTANTRLNGQISLSVTDIEIPQQK